MANTGNKYYDVLLKVSDDENEFPLDVNDQYTSISGLPQASKPNDANDPDYIAPVQDLAFCPKDPIAPCNQLASSGGKGVTDYSVLLDNPDGGVVIIDLNAFSATDKLEIISEKNGVYTKKATSSMTDNGNYGPFDDVYGTRPNNVVPSTSQASTVTQFVGTSKATPPDRIFAFQADTGLNIPLTTNMQQRVWWKYSAADYDDSVSVNIRVTGIDNTRWDFVRVCLTT